jgi:hypothetical protein
MNEVEGTIEALDEETLNQLKQSAIQDTDIKETQNDNEDIQALDKSIQKPKKPRTEKQIEALKKAQETRRKNLALRKQQKEQLKQAIADNEGVEPPEPVNVKPVKRPRKKKPVVVYEDDESSDEEVIVVKRKPRRKRKPKKKIVYEEPSSSSEEEEVIKKPTKKLQKSKKVVEPETDSSDESDWDGYEKEYSYPVNRPLKYSDVFRFA